MLKIQIYTDGACSGNPGEGGWGAILLHNGTSKKISGYEAHTTNNRMELLAVISALSELKFSCQVVLYSDSAYVVNALNQKWLQDWERNNWRTASKKPVQNQDLWERLAELLNIHEVKFVKVKGHADNEYNNECDRLARQAIKNRGN